MPGEATGIGLMPEQLNLEEAPLARLIARAQSGDTSAFDELMVTHERRVVAIAWRMLGNREEARDAAQETFLRVYRHLHKFDRERDFAGWLYRITINHCQNMNQSWHARHMFSNADDAVWETAGSVEGDPLRVLEIKELGQRIQKTLDGLPEEYRLLLLLVADQQLSYDEIGELTEQTADAVRGKLHRARKAFAAAFQKTA